MMLAAKHLDPVMGVDVHIIQPPGPVPPVPIPHPHIGIVFDPCDYVPILGATVQIGGIPRAVAGTAGKCVPPHIPIGGMFVKPPSNENEIFMGSSTVVFEDEPASFMALPVLSCQCVGMVAPLRPKKKSKTMSLVLPTSVVLPIPAGPPVMIGGPPTISMMAMGMRAGMAALGKAFKKLRKLQKASKRMKRLSKRIHQAADKVLDKLKVKKGSRARNRVHRAVCSVTGHPIDVATGKMFTEAVDLELPGPLPFKLERVWYSTSTYAGPLGVGWHHRYDMSVVATDEVVVVRLADGRYASFVPPEEGRPSRNAQERMELDRSRGGYVLTEETTGLSYHFGAAADGQVEKTFAGEGREALLSRVEDRNGNRIQLLYRDARLIKIVDSGGREMPVGLDDEGRIVSISAPDPERPGRQRVMVSYRYDEAGDLVEVRDALGHPFRYAYRNHLLIRETDRNGYSFHFEYDGDDENARCIRTWGDGGMWARTLRYDPEKRRTEVVDSRGGKTIYCWNDLGLVEREIDPLGAEKRTEWDELGYKLSETDALGNTTRYAYNEGGHLVSETDPLGKERRIDYDERDHPVTLTDELGRQWRREYDERGNVVAVTDPAGATTRYQVGDRGLPVAMIDPKGRRIRLDWDPQGNVRRIVNRVGAETRITYDGLGRIKSQLDSEGGETSFNWDAQGRLVKLRDAEKRTFRWRYDGEGNIVESVDPLGRSEQYSYGPRGQLEEAVRPSGVATRYTYDRERDLVAVVDPTGRPWTFQRDAVGNVIAEQDFIGRRLSYEYDASGRLIARTNGRGQRTVSEWDEKGALIRRRFHDGQEETFEYDQAGQLLRTQNVCAQVTFLHDACGRVVAEILNGQEVRSGYDIVGNRVERLSPFGRTLSFNYDAEDRLSSVTDPSGVLLGLQYDRLGREIRRTLPEVVTGRRKYTKTGELQDQQVERKGRELLKRHYRYDPTGQLTEIHDSTFGEVRFKHDLEGRLESAEYPDGLERFEYDDAGNVPAAPPGLVADQGRRAGCVKQEGDWNLRFDADGNLVEKQNGSMGFRYQYDAADRLVKVERRDGEVVEFAYDPLGRRISKRTGERFCEYLWDGDVLLGDHVKNGGTNKRREYIFRPDTFEPMAIIEDQTDICLLECDQVGTPRMVVHRTGEVTWEAAFSGYGMLRQLRGAAEMDLRYPGQLFDPETGLAYNRFRYYDAGLRAYTQPDPVGILGGLEMYNFVPNPTEWVDPYGLSCAPTNPITKAKLPRRKGKIRYLPPADWTPSRRLPRGPQGGYMDKFGNEWTKGPSRTKGEPFEWDVQLGPGATAGVRKFSRDGSHLNVSLKGRITHL